MTQAGVQQPSTADRIRAAMLIAQQRMNAEAVERAMETDDDAPFELVRAIRTPAGAELVRVGVVRWNAQEQRFDIFADMFGVQHGDGPIGYAARELSHDWSLYAFIGMRNEETWYGYCSTLSYAVDLLVAGERYADRSDRLAKGICRTAA
jgi:hypothetical protein